MRSLVACKTFGAWLALLLVVGCGGGGGNAVTPAADPPRQPQATVVRDTNPTAARLALGPADFLPSTTSARWEFERTDDSGRRLGSTTLEFSPLGSQLRSVETDDGLGSETLTFRLDAAGWVLPDLGNTRLPAGAVAVIGEITQYPAPFHAIGTTRVQFRSGNYGSDLDGDGVNESFEFEFRQTMVGFESIAGPHGPIEALHIRDEIVVTVIPSQRGRANLRASAVSDAWLARGVGLVRERVQSIASDGADVFAPYTLALSSVRIGGTDPLDGNAITDVQVLDVVNRDLVFDAPRGRYYASVPGSVIGSGNRIAVIDAASGAVSYSGVVGSEPGALALAADGASLYVAVDGSSELVRLALPGLTEIGRMRLPADSSFGPYVTQSLAASPVDPGVVALSLAYTGLSPRHAGVLLVREMVGQPRRTQGHTGSNIIVFGREGRFVYGYNNETTEFGLRRIEVLSDGLVEREVLGGALGQFYVRTIDRTANGLVLGNRLFAEDTLAPLGLISAAMECHRLSGAVLACVTNTFDSSFELLLADAANATISRRLRAPRDSQSFTRVLVAGPSGQIAVRDRIGHPASNEATRILLMRHPSLP